MTPSPVIADTCIVGFGFAGLATLANLVRDSRDARVVVVAADPAGHGVAYATRDPEHLLNVRTERMGAWADDPGHFARWLTSDGGLAACRDIGVPVPGPMDFAPRAVFARYLTALREATLETARLHGVTVTVVAETATGLRRVRDGWVVATDRGTQVPARTCVLAVGHEARGTLAGDDVLRGAAGVTHAPAGDGPAVIAGTGLSAIDAVLSLRGTGFAGEIVLASRHGLLPRPHCRRHRPYAFTSARLARLRSAADVRDLVLETIDAGRDWRLALEGLRPHTQQVWRQFSPAAQREVVQRHVAVWGAHRHRMATPVAARIQAERDAGTLRVAAARVRRDAGDVVLDHADGTADRLRPAALVDCTGNSLDWAGSADPLRRGVVADGHAVAHHTGLGLAADARHGIGPGLFAVGSVLTGELWESGAVPELREQAATVAQAVAAPAAAAVAVA